MSVRMKITLSFLVMALFMVLQAVVAFQQNNHSRELVDRAIHKNYRVVEDLNRLSGYLQQIRRYEKEYFIYIADVGKKQKYVGEWRDALAKIRDQLGSMRENGDARYARRDLTTFAVWDEAVTFYDAEFERIVARYAGLDGVTIRSEGGGVYPSVEANGMIHEGKSRLAVVLDGAEKMSGTKTEEAIVSARAIEASFDQMELVSAALTVGAILFSVLLLIGIYRSVVRTLNTLLHESERIYNGNLSAAVEPIYVPELRTLANALEQMRLDRLAVVQRKSQRAA